MSATTPTHAQEANVEIHASQVLGRVSPYLTGACIEDVNHEIYGGLYSQMIFGESFQEPPPQLPRKDLGQRQPTSFEGAEDSATSGISRMWSALYRGSAHGKGFLETHAPFTGRQSQRMTFEDGIGEFGIENQGLNRWGMYFIKGKPYDGYVWARSDKPVELFVALESRDGARVLAEKRLKVSGKDWQRLDFDLTPDGTDIRGRFALKLKRPGSAVVGHAFLEPGKWGRFMGLPDRKDVAASLKNEGISVLRYGGSMVNAPEYRWKKMIGPRDRRPSYRGTWYDYSSNGWGILDFLNFCEEAGFLAIPDFNIDESPGDMADFIEYVNGPAGSRWGRQRAVDGHPRPYNLAHLELGNEERVNENYWKKFKPLAEAIWAKDPKVTLVVGDFVYTKRIIDPWQFSGADSGITNLAAHQKILRLAKEHGREVWFDLHVGTEGPRPDSTVDATLSFIDALGKIADGAKYRVAVFELNANNHSQRRALANALAINAFERDGRVAVVTSANCLQPDGQNDNGWNQGLLFLNPSKVWLQPPGYVTRMISRNHQALLVKCNVDDVGKNLDLCAESSEDGKALVLRVVNPTKEAVRANIRLDGFTRSSPWAQIEELAGPLDASNTAANPDAIETKSVRWLDGTKNGLTTYEFPPYSFTVIRFE